MLRCESEMHDVAVGDHVRFSFEPHLACIACPALATEGDIVLVPDGLGANEAPLEIGVDRCCGLRRLGPPRDRPGRRLLWSGGEIGDQIEKLVTGANEPVEPGLLEIALGDPLKTCPMLL